MNVKIANSWKKLLQEEFEKPYFKKLVDYIKQEYASQKVYPPGSLIFNAFNQCSLDELKVVIVGQDPYHGAGQANGLCFSVNDSITFPRSLNNIFKEIANDIDTPFPVSGNLEKWAKQGVLLLNATLTVRARLAGSHQNQGWETFTDNVLRKISEEKENIVFLLWGAFAQQKTKIINSSKHHLMKAAHPSPFSADKGFFGCKHFSKTNNFLSSIGKKEIMW